MTINRRREQADELERAWMVVRRVAINGIVTLDIVTDAADRLRASCDEPLPSTAAKSVARSAPLTTTRAVDRARDYYCSCGQAPRGEKR